MTAFNPMNEMTDRSDRTRASLLIFASLLFPALLSAQAPVNDLCSNAIAITCNSVTSGTTTGATTTGAAWPGLRHHPG